MKKLLLVTAALNVVPASAFADETLKIRTVMHVTAAQQQDVGDVAGHVLALSRFEGLASFPDGTVGPTYFVTAADMAKGVGTVNPLYYNVTAADGSALWLKVSLTGKPNGSRVAFSGPMTVIGGTGKFAGAKGDGVFTGERLTAETARSVGAPAYNDLVINLKAQGSQTPPQPIAVSSNANGGETLKWRHVQHAASFVSQNVDDVKGHMMSVYRIPGMAFLPDGSTGTSMVVGASDLVNGSGPLNGYYSLTLKDGSVLWLKFTGTTETKGVNDVPRKGTAIVIGGTGKFAGAKGEGTWDGNGTNVGPDVISYIDNVINVRK
jgi:hypothetical protein